MFCEYFETACRMHSSSSNELPTRSSPFNYNTIHIAFRFHRLPQIQKFFRNKNPPAKPGVFHVRAVAQSFKKLYLFCMSCGRLTSTSIKSLSCNFEYFLISIIFFPSMNISYAVSLLRFNSPISSPSFLISSNPHFDLLISQGLRTRSVSRISQ